jgi:hypothetical protein
LDTHEEYYSSTPFEIQRYEISARRLALQPAVVDHAERAAADVDSVGTAGDILRVCCTPLVPPGIEVKVSLFIWQVEQSFTGNHPSAIIHSIGAAAAVVGSQTRHTGDSAS